MRRRFALAGLVALVPGAALAHVAGAPVKPWSEPWSFEPWAILPVLVSAGAYALGFARLRARSGPGRAQLDRQAGLFAAGLLILAAAVVSPLHAMGGHSFSAHMLEHELIMLAAAPLLALSRPLGVMIWAFPATGRRTLAAAARSGPVAGAWGAVSDPAVATAVQAVALWIWHLPSLFDMALAHEAWHAAQHLSFFLSALNFWSAMTGPRRSVWTAAVCLFATSMISGALGAFMALSPSPWYAAYARLGLAAFGLTPAQDQQLAGVLMWVPGGLVHAVAALGLLAPSLRSHAEPADA